MSSRFAPDDRELADALVEIASTAILQGGRGQKVLVVGKIDGSTDVGDVISADELEGGTHISRLREIQEEDEFEVEALIHISFTHENFVMVQLLLVEDALFRLRVPDPPQRPRWVPVSERLAYRWRKIWGSKSQQT